MARRKQRNSRSAELATETSDSPATATSPEADSAKPAEVSAPRIPSSAVRGLLSAAVVFHLAALFLSYSAIVEPSQTHSKSLDALTPYLRSTHFAADGRPFYLAHVTPDERPHRLQIAKRPSRGTLTLDHQTEWTTVEPEGRPGLAASDRYGRWMKLVATLSQSDQPSLAAALLMPLIRSDATIGAVRVVRLPTELTTVEEDSEGPVYFARVIRDGESIQLVAVESQRLTTQVREPDSDATQTPPAVEGQPGQ